MNIGINEIEGGIRNSMVRHPGCDVDFLPSRCGGISPHRSRTGRATEVAMLSTEFGLTETATRESRPQ